MKKLLFILANLFFIQSGYSQVGINTTTPNAQLDVKSGNQATPSNTDGILIPRIDAFPLTNPTAAQQGMMVYLTTVSAGKQPGFYYWDNTGLPQWKGVGSNAGWGLTGNSGTNPAANFIGTTDNNDLIFKRGNQFSGMLGESNTVFGVNALDSNVNALKNIAIGPFSLTSMNYANGGLPWESNNLAIGYNAMHDFVAEEDADGFNVAIGNDALSKNIDGFGNVGVGVSSLFSNTRGTGNTAVGYISGGFNVLGSGNTAVGSQSLQGVSGSNNTAIGTNVLSASTGDQNTAFGVGSGATLTTGNNNLLIGHQTEVPIPTGNDQMSIGNVIYGADMGTTALGKIGIGVPVPTEKLEVNGKTKTTDLQVTTGAVAGNVLTSDALGNATWQAPSGANAWGLNGNAATMSNFIGTTSAADLFFKRNSINSGRISDHNTAFGFNCLNPLNTGIYNVAFGVNALAANTSGINNTAYGDGALQKNTSGGENSAYGSDALRENLLGSDNIANGFFAMSDNKNASKNIAIGRYALRNQIFTNGGAAFDTNNIAIGIEALNANSPTTTTNGKDNVALGNYSLQFNTIGSENTAIGIHSLNTNKSGSKATAIGTRAMYYANNTTTPFDSKNVAVGYEALRGSTTAANNVGNLNTAMGYQALWSNTSGDFNTAIGESALRNNETGAANTAIGHKALMGLAATPMTGNANIAIGSQSLNRNVSGAANIAIGNLALNNNSSGQTNIGIGYQSLNNNTTGNGNIAIGFKAGYNETGSNKLFIDSDVALDPLIYGEFDNDLIKINGRLKVNTIATVGNEMQVKNSNMYVHLADLNLNFTTASSTSDDFMVSSEEGGSETGGIRGDGNNVTIWSPGDDGRQLRIVDEDNWIDNNGNPYDNGAEVAYIAANGQYFQVSDKNKKENIAKIEEASTKISKISGYTYQYKLLPEEVKKGQKPVAASGVLAQEIEQVLPEAVQKNESGEYFVDYAAITPLLIEAIKEQEAKIKSLETTNAEILKRLEKLEIK